MTICGQTMEQAEQCTYIVHYSGKCSVKTGTFEELKPMCLKLLDSGLTAEIVWFMFFLYFKIFIIVFFMKFNFLSAQANNTDRNIYDFIVEDINGEDFYFNKLNI